MTAVSAGVDLAVLRDSLASWPSGVTVVTTRDAAGTPRGFTATAFSSLSLRPPLVLVCLDRGADCVPAFESADTMAVHVLREDQAPLAQRFATKNVDKYEGLTPGRGFGGVPLLDGAVARFECELERRIGAGDHLILVGMVRHCALFSGRPLVYFGRAFHGLPTESHVREAETP